MLEITQDKQLPGTNYFTMSDVTPFLQESEGNYSLVINNAQGPRKNWGRPECTSTVVVHSDSLVAVHVSFHHRYRGSQGWHYFVATYAGWSKKCWSQLKPDHQAEVLANFKKAPSWANQPGKVKVIK